MWLMYFIYIIDNVIAKIDESGFPLGLQCNVKNRELNVMFVIPVWK